MTRNFTKKVNGQILYDGIKMELFVPNDFFKNNLAEQVGQSYYIFGSLNNIRKPYMLSIKLNLVL